MADFKQGQQHAKRGAWQSALTCFARAARRAPDDGAIALSHARTLLSLGRTDEAAQEAVRAFNLDRASDLACAFATHCLMEGKRYADAARCLQALAPERPRNHDHHRTLARALQLSGQYREATAAYMQALALDMTDADAHYQLGLCLNELSMKEEATQCLRTALTLGVGDHALGIWALLSYFDREACNWAGAAEGLASLSSCVDALPADAAIPTAPFAHVTLDDDPMRQLRAARSLARSLAKQASPMPVRASDWRAGGPRRLRLGYLSADFHEHATSILMAEMLEHHDRTRFEVTLYSHGREDRSALRERMKKACEHFVELRGQSDRDIAERIRADRCDLLIDLKGYTRNNRVGVFAWRPASVSATFLGFPGSTGADCIDYVIGDAFVTPLEHGARFTERIAQMPASYQPNDRQRALPPAPSRADEGLRDDAFVMSGFTQPYKISEEVFHVWCVLLDALPRAQLWLLEWNEQSRINLDRAARARGIDPSRIVWADRKRPADHMARMQLADVFLDTWPCNAHTTASDALWAGVPVVTFPGETFAGRVATSLVHAAGVPELACENLEHYARTVVELAHDAPRLARLREALVRARSEAPLFDSARFTRDFEALALRMMQRHVDGLPPAPLAAAPSLDA